MFAIEGMEGLWKLFIPRHTIWGIVLFFDNWFWEFFFFDRQFAGIFYSSTNRRLRNLWCVELDFSILSIVFINEVCDKMSNSNIPDPNEENWQLLTRLWDTTKQRGDGKCYCPCSQCRGFKKRIILIATATNHCREHGHAKRGNEYHPFVGWTLYCFYIVFLY